MEQRFYICRHCNKIVALVKDSKVPLMCCGAKMEELIPGSTDAATEKHVPVCTVEGNRAVVTVGEAEHPMTDEHYIEWVSIQTKQGNQRKPLAPGQKPTVCFALCEGDQVEAVYAYCNLHSLWKAEIKAEPVCPLKPVDTDTNENYVVCKCNNVSYFDILNEVHKHEDLNDLLAVFEQVKNTTHCSTGCGGCYEKVLAIISDTIMKN